MALIQALDVAGPGDTICLADKPHEPIVTMNVGAEGCALIIKGGRGVVISGFSGDGDLMWDQKVVDVRHSWITLDVGDTCYGKGLMIDGHLNGLDTKGDYVDIHITVIGQDAPADLRIDGTTTKSSLISFHLSDMYMHNCG